MIPKLLLTLKVHDPLTPNTPRISLTSNKTTPLVQTNSKFLQLVRISHHSLSNKNDRHFIPEQKKLDFLSPFVIVGVFFFKSCTYLFTIHIQLQSNIDFESWYPLKKWIEMTFKGRQWIQNGNNIKARGETSNIKQLIWEYISWILGIWMKLVRTI